MGNETVENGSEGGKRPLVSPVPTPAKRLKQACLPFKVISSDLVVKTSTQLKQKRLLTDSKQPVDGSQRSDENATTETPTDNCKENESPGKTNKRMKLLDNDGARNHSETVIDLTEVLSDNRHSAEDDLGSSYTVTTSQPELDTTGNHEQMEISLIEDDVEKDLNESASTSALSSLTKTATVIPKKVKRLRKTKRDPKEELEKAKRMEERKKAQDEKDKLKAELQRLRQEREIEKLKKEKERLMKKEQEELERRDKLLLKEEEKKRKQEVLDAKLEEKERKNKEKLDVENEKRKAKEEDERIKNKTKTAFANFFVKKEPIQTVWQKPKNLGTFLPFQVKENMRLAPVHRNTLANTPEITQKMDSLLSTQCDTTLYLEEFKKSKKVSRKSSRTWTVESKDVEIIQVDLDVAHVGKKPTRAKLLQFEENVRPPYWGTWCKRSNVIHPRHPLKRDENYLDYEVDSNEEWEEEEPGESLSHTEDEKESEDDYEVDNEFFVPHGYLSNEEGHEEDKQSVSPDTLKAQLKLKEQEFERDRKKKCMKIKPILFGCFWMDEGQNVMNKALEQYAAVMTETSLIDTQFTLAKVTTESEKTKKTPSQMKYQKEVSEDVMPDFIRLIHGNRHSFKIIGAEFAEFLSRRDAEKEATTRTAEDGSSEGKNEMSFSENATSSSQVTLKLSYAVMRRRLREIASWGKFPEPGAVYNKFAWFVNKEFRDKYNLTDLPIPNQWKYCISLEAFKTVELTPTTLKPKANLKRISDSFFLKKLAASPKLDSSDPKSSTSPKLHSSDQKDDGLDVVVVHDHRDDGSDEIMVVADCKDNGSGEVTVVDDDKDDECDKIMVVDVIDKH